MQVEEVLFAAGEALSFIWGEIPVTVDMILKSNYSSLSLSSNYLSGDTWTISETKHTMTETDEIESRVKIRDSIFRKLFDVLLYSSRKEERCAGAVWLLSLTMYNGQHYKIQQQLPDIQVMNKCIFFNNFILVKVTCFLDLFACASDNFSCTFFSGHLWMQISS